MSFNETEKLIKASEEGDIKSVQNLLEKNVISVNGKGILIKKLS